MASPLYEKMKRLKLRIIDWKGRNGMNILRVSLGVVFIWFGGLKFFPGLSPAEIIAGKTISKLTFGHIRPNISLPFLACWECLIGIGLLFRRMMSLVLILLYFQMAGTLLPLFLFRTETWTAGLLVPTLLGQYIIKNCVLISAGIVIGATVDGGQLITDPGAAQKGMYWQILLRRYQRRFQKNPETEAGAKIIRLPITMKKPGPSSRH